MTDRLDVLVAETYKLLLGIVKTTAVSKRVLKRPPFTFLHKLLVETLAPIGLFADYQLEFAALVTREDKAAFLTRAIAFVTFAMLNLKLKRISCLLLVSPVKVLAGVGVEDTLEWLQQLCEVCRSDNVRAKDDAVQEVVRKGDAQLYTAGVTFRRGLVLIQAIVRTFIRRRVGKRRSIVGPHRTPSPQSDPMSMQVGTRFLKELADGRVYDGVIASVKDKRYKLEYDQDNTAVDEVDEIEMKIILEESQRLMQLRERILSAKSRQDSSVDLSITNLPDLSVQREESPVGRRASLLRLRSIRDVGSSGANSNATPLVSRRSTLTRAPTRENIMLRTSSASSDHSTTPSPTNSIAPQRSASVDGINDAAQLLAAQEAASAAVLETECTNPSWRPEGDESAVKRQRVSPTSVPDQQHDDPKSESFANPAGSSNAEVEQSWQTSLKAKLKLAQAATEPPPLGTVSLNAAASRSSPSAESSIDRSTHRSIAIQSPLLSMMPSFPELRIPGKKKLPSMVSKRKPQTQGTALSSNGPPATTTKARADSVTSRDSVESPSVTLTTPSTTTQEPVRRTGKTAADLLIDKALGSAYHMTDAQTQEEAELFRVIVRRIDTYMKRKHLRVIDLFRFCDADGNGSISPPEMIDTLSQMEIQLSPEQAHAFINHIDKDGNGVIDVDEFEELVRIARRNEAQREQLRKELHHGKLDKDTSSSTSATTNLGKTKRNPLVKYRQRILDELKLLDVGEVGAVSGAQVKAAIVRLQLPGLAVEAVDELLDRARAQFVAPVSVLPGEIDPTGTETSVETEAEPTVYLQHVSKALHDLEWSQRANRFLDHAWLGQFDAHLERAHRDFELI